MACADCVVLPWRYAAGGGAVKHRCFQDHYHPEGGALHVKQLLGQQAAVRSCFHPLSQPLEAGAWAEESSTSISAHRWRADGMRGRHGIARHAAGRIGLEEQAPCLCRQYSMVCYRTV